ncbi:MAG TPA: hypothetical protein VEX35_01780 [Allosphingosinicella sp.]|nr:hypothetical protein [Allosphingosinicella sp.]
MANPASIPENDPELAVLLAFEPVPRRQQRANGWTAERQQDFIAALVETGNYRLATHAVGMTASGAYQLRKEADAEDFSRAWDEAIALHRTRSGTRAPRPSAGAPRHARELRVARASASAAPPELEEEERGALLDELVKLYAHKLQAERRARLAGRVVEADLHVRQLAYMEIVLAVGGRAQQLLDEMKHGDLHLVQIVATPLSTLLERTRRAIWQEKGEADRPPPAPLGAHDESRATGEPSHRNYNSARDGDYNQWCRREDAKAALASEAQKAWEEKARAEAEEWAKREAAVGTPRDPKSGP